MRLAAAWSARLGRFTGSLTACRLVDIIIAMRKKTASPRQEPQKRRIVGFSLPPDLAAEVKVEAAKRNLSLRKLFSEIWTLYKATKSA